MKNKKPLWITLLALDIAVIVFLFVIHIFMIYYATIPAKDWPTSGLFHWLMQNTTLYGVLFVVPLFLILAANIIGLVIYVRKSTKSQPVTLDDLTPEQRAELAKKVLAQMSQPAEEPKPEETPEEK